MTCYLLASNICYLQLHSDIQPKAQTKIFFHIQIEIYQSWHPDIYLVSKELFSIDKTGSASTYLPMRPLQGVAHNRHIPACICNKHHCSLLFTSLSKNQGQSQQTCKPCNEVSLQAWISNIPPITSFHKQLLQLGKHILYYSQIMILIQSSLSTDRYH